MDIVIYAAQLSQSFFTCLALAVESFLDLFLIPSKATGKDDFDESSTLTGSGDKTVPAGALSTIALWCDAELGKFSNVFASKVLGKLSLTPLSAPSTNKITETITKFEAVADIAHLKKQLKASEDMGEYTVASKLRKKIAIQEQEEKEGALTYKVASPRNVSDKDRQVRLSLVILFPLGAHVDHGQIFLNMQLRVL